MESAGFVIFTELNSGTLTKKEEPTEESRERRRVTEEEEDGRERETGREGGRKGRKHEGRRERLEREKCSSTYRKSTETTYLSETTQALSSSGFMHWNLKPRYQLGWA